MSKQISDLLEEFIINARLILPTLGYMAFEPSPSSNIDNDVENKLLYFSRNKGNGGNAIGKIASDGFWVLKDSYIFPQVAEYTPSGIKKAREKYRASIDENGILQEDLCFGSPSFASTFVCGKTSNGLIEWKDKYGIPLKNLDSITTKLTYSNNKNSTENTQTRIITNTREEILYLASRKISAR